MGVEHAEPLVANDSEAGRARAVSDVGVVAENPNKVREAMMYTLGSFIISNGVGVAFNFVHPRKEEAMMEFYAGYILELALSLDNLFAFYLVFKYFKVKSEKAQNRVLFWGIVGAIVLRALMIGIGAAAIHQYRPVLLVAAAFLIWTTYIVFFADEDDDEDISDNAALKLAQWMVPVDGAYEGSNFFNSAGKATPLLLVLVTIEFSDVMFAFDSVPAIFGVTEDGYVVWAACMCAIMCLRSLYTLIVQFVAELEYMNKAIGLVLFFIAIKLLADLIFGYHISITVSLTVVAGILTTGTLASIFFKPEDDDEEEEEGDMEVEIKTAV
jgi:TerC family integral membrane protein